MISLVWKRPEDSFLSHSFSFFKSESVAKFSWQQSAWITWSRSVEFLWWRLRVLGRCKAPVIENTLTPDSSSTHRVIHPVKSITQIFITCMSALCSSQPWFIKVLVVISHRMSQTSLFGVVFLQTQTKQQSCFVFRLRNPKPQG